MLSLCISSHTHSTRSNRGGVGGHCSWACSCGVRYDDLHPLPALSARRYLPLLCRGADMACPRRLSLFSSLSRHVSAPDEKNGQWSDPAPARAFCLPMLCSACIWPICRMHVCICTSQPLEESSLDIQYAFGLAGRAATACLISQLEAATTRSNVQRPACQRFLDASENSASTPNKLSDPTHPSHGRDPTCWVA